jgi:hypothetical protein
MGRNLNIVRPPSLTLSIDPADSCYSRSGDPNWSAVTSSPTAPSWSTSVSWQKGDILNPSSYNSNLEGADAVVHTMGILLEADYKGVVSGQVSPIAGLQRAFSATKAGTQNPLERGADEPLKPQEKDGQLTYEVMNRDTGVLALARPSTKPSHYYTHRYIQCQDANTIPKPSRSRNRQN